MPDWLRSWLHKLHFRVTHASRFPKGDLLSSLMNLASRGFEPTHIVDVGANAGKWSRKAARVFPRAAFTLIEPQIEMQTQLDRFCRQHGRARWINAGAADVVGEMVFTVAPDTVSSSFTIPAGESLGNGLRQRRVPVITLDHLASQVIHAIPQMVKIDAEGFECRILQGARGLLGQTELFLLELPLVDPPTNWNSFAEIIAFMDREDYVPYDFTSFQRRPYDGALGLCEVAFARRCGILRSFGGWAKAA